MTEEERELLLMIAQILVPMEPGNPDQESWEIWRIRRLVQDMLSK